MGNHRSISFDELRESFISSKKIDKKIRYASSRGIEGITFLSNTPIREEFSIKHHRTAPGGTFSLRSNEVLKP
ncbi:hypothetical protein DPMN_025877 [Dreissena polymorpha]|uniref:Uncharacterized protein n=1 Tax=Dreissena polymorpha TaxID=45954 RepID=A0A9D4LSD9_DREPO|nr:hypothetical protein DPMN_025877 [Dreissena polymorpha]